MSIRIREKFGGRQGRFAGGRLRLVSFLDPWRRERLAFDDARIATLWLLRFSDPKVRTIGVAGRQAGGTYTRIDVRPHLRVTQEDGHVSLEFVAFDNEIDELATRIRHENDGSSVSFKVHRWREVVARQVVTDNVDRLRRNLCAVLDHYLHDVTEQVRLCLTHARPVHITRGQLNMAVGPLFGTDSRQAVDGALSQLWGSRAVAIDLERRYGNETTICLLP